MSAGTYRERRLRKAERLREWAEKRERKAGAAYQASYDATAQIPLGQPILLGHHSQGRHERAIERSQRQATQALEHGRKADEFEQKAANIEAAADHAIYSDDADAVERLRERIAELEAERERIKRYNASCRKAAKSGGVGDTSILRESERADLATVAQHAAFQLGPGGAMPRYKLSNLGGNINRNRQRLAQLEPKP